MDDLQFYDLPEEMKLQVLIHMSVDDLIDLVNAQPMLNYLVQDVARHILKQSGYNKYEGLSWLQTLYCIDINMDRVERIIKIDNVDMFDCTYGYNIELFKDECDDIIDKVFIYGAVKIIEDIIKDDRKITTIINCEEVSGDNYAVTILNIYDILEDTLKSKHDTINVLKVASVINESNPMYLSHNRLYDNYIANGNILDFELMMDIFTNDISKGKINEMLKDLLVNLYGEVVDSDEKIMYLINETKADITLDELDIEHMNTLKQRGRLSNVQIDILNKLS